jgi:uncharacterized protein YrrD
VGRLDRVVMQPQSRSVTHIVVRQGFLFTEDKLIPVGQIASAHDERVTLKATADQLGDLALFEETHYAPLTDEERALAGYQGVGYAAPLYYYPPAQVTGFAHPAGVFDPVPLVQAREVGTERNTPVGSIALQEGAQVVNAQDEEVGTVERVITGDRERRMTHLVLAQGLIFKKRKLIPSNWVQVIREDVVRLNVSTNMIDNLPEFTG